MKISSFWLKVKKTLGINELISRNEKGPFITLSLFAHFLLKLIPFLITLPANNC